MLLRDGQGLKYLPQATGHAEVLSPLPSCCVDGNVAPPLLTGLGYGLIRLPVLHRQVSEPCDQFTCNDVFIITERKAPAGQQGSV